MVTDIHRRLQAGSIHHLQQLAHDIAELHTTMLLPVLQHRLRLKVGQDLQPAYLDVVNSAAFKSGYTLLKFLLKLCSIRFLRIQHGSLCPLQINAHQYLAIPSQ